MSQEDYLFNQADLNRVLEGYRLKMLEQIDSIDVGRLLNTSVEDWCDHFETEFRVEVPKLNEQAIHVDQIEVQVDVSHDRSRGIRDRSRPCYIPGTQVSFYIPFTGDGELFKYRPSTYSLSPPQATVQDRQIIVTQTVLDQNSKSVRADFDRTLGSIRQMLGYAEAEVDRFNKGLRTEAKAWLEMRRAKLLKDQGFVADLGFPLKRREDAPKTYVVPEVRRQAPFPPPVATESSFTPDPTLSEKEYDNILSIMSNMVQVMEKSPAAFQHLKEEEIRTHFLVQLNGQYRGQATGETFNCKGKTDILIQHYGKNLFIAECKFWKGAQGLLETVNQIMRYTTWRDTKTAVVLFNRNKDFSSVLKCVPESIRKHPHFKRDISVDSESCFRFILHHPDDRNREIVLTIMAFNVPS